MRTLAIAVFAFLALAAPASAQGWVRALWDMNPPSESVTYYTIQRDEDASTRQYVYPATGPNCTTIANTCYAEFEITDNAQHTLQLVAANQFGISPTARIAFSLGTPTMPANLRLTNPFADSGAGLKSVTPAAPASRSGPPPPPGKPVVDDGPRPRDTAPGGKPPSAPTVR